MRNYTYEQKIAVLDWGIIFSSLLLIITIYLPLSIWAEEEELKKIGRQRMTDIMNAQEFYFEITGKYTKDGEHLFELVEAAMDSLIADSLFLGNQLIHLDGEVFPIALEKGFEVRVDTTFSDPTEIYYSYKDTIYTVSLRNIDSGGFDTLFVNVRDLNKYKEDKNFNNIVNMDIVQRSEFRTDYLRKKYHLDSSFLKCPITNEPYIFEIDSTSDELNFQITSPLHLLETPYEESRYLVFKFEAGDHGFIRGGQKSWAE